MYTIYTGNSQWADSLIKAYGRQIPVRVGPRVDDSEWAIYVDGEPYDGPHPITQTSGREARNKIRDLGTLATSSKAISPVQPAPTRQESDQAHEAVTLETVTGNIMGLQKKTIRNFMEIGRWLIEAKKLVGHGNWLEYLQTVKLAEWTAQACMRMFEEWGANPRLIEDLNFTDAVILLSAPKEARPALIEVARTQPNHVLRKAVRLLRRSVIKEPSQMAPTQEAPVMRAVLIVTRPGEPEPPAEAKSPPDEAEPILIPALAPVPQSQAPAPLPPTAKLPLQDPPLPITALVAMVESPPVLPAAVSPPEPDSDHEHKEKALAVNMAISAIMDAIARNRSSLDTAQGKAFGDWIDLEALYELETAMDEIKATLGRIASDCTRYR